MKRPAFTLVELLVVIAIIGLLSTVAIVALGSSQVNARGAKRRADMLQITKALELYYAENNSYPSTLSAPCLGYMGVVYCGSCGAYGGLPNTDSPTSWIPGLTSGGYITQLPSDPNSGRANAQSSNETCRTDATRNCYLYASNGIHYALMAYCTPEGPALSSNDLFYSPFAWTWKLTDDRAATIFWN